VGLGARLAEGVAARFGRDPWVVAGRLGVEALEGPLVGRVRELYFDDGEAPTVVLAEGLSRAEAREAVACGVGHHVLTEWARRQGEPVPRAGGAHRAEVEEFAAFLLISTEMMRDALVTAPPSPEACGERWGVTGGLVRRRLGVREDGG